MGTQGARQRRITAAAVAAVLVVALSGCLAPPGDTSKVTLIDTTDVDGWHFDYYRNLAYPCSITGYQTFAIGTRVGSSATADRPLWVKMRGGGVGYFDQNGTPQPTAGNKSEITLDKMLEFDTPGLMAQAKAAPEGFRVLLVSMCSHDVYGGTNTADPNNPNTTPDGKKRPTTGLISTKAAIQYARDAYPTSKFFLHGTSAGSAGTFPVAWALQLQGLPPAGIIADSGIVDRNRSAELPAECLDGADAPAVRAGVAARVDPVLVDPDNLPDLLVARGDFTVPILQVWNHGDPNTCGSTPITCHLSDDTSPTMGSTDCRHENLRRVIEAQGPDSRSRNMPVCVTPAGNPPCVEHVVTTRANGVNTDPASPADYQSAILDWVRERLADPPPD